jgi:ABC-type nitrate/sulfonate/bicarbonate transport system ATPase subunit
MTALPPPPPPGRDTSAGMRSDGGAVIELRDVAKRYGSLTALEGVDLAVAHGESVAIVGPSGCGKSTLLSVVAGLDDASAGSVGVAGERAAEGRLERCALMPQKDLLLPWRSALDNAALALENAGLPRAQARERALPLLRSFDLEPFAGSRPARLSGGMRQRAAFARTLLAGKEVLLLDEPFGALDAITRAQMQEWLRGALDAEPRTVLLVTHDVEEALVVCDRVAVMSARPGRIVLELEARMQAPTRRELVALPEFVRARAAALEALG